MQLISKNNIYYSLNNTSSEIVFQDGALKITAGAMREIVNSLAKNGYDYTLNEIKHNVSQSELLAKDIELRHNMLGKRN